MQESINRLYEYVSSLGNHKLEKCSSSTTAYAIVRRNKQYDFGLDFTKLEQLGFKPSHMQSFNGKDEIIVMYVGR